MDGKLLYPVKSFRMSIPMRKEIDRLASALDLPKASVMRLALKKGLPLIAPTEKETDHSEVHG